MKVCRAWKDITTSRSFWKLVCMRNGVDWNAIPESLKEKEAAWMVFYAASKNKILSKNFVQNHSGHGKSAFEVLNVFLFVNFSIPTVIENFDNWVVVRAGGERFVVEAPPMGIPPLPSDPRYDGLNDSAFVTSFQWCIQKQTIDLWDAGLTPAVMMTMVPFQMTCVEM